MFGPLFRIEIWWISPILCNYYFQIIQAPKNLLANQPQEC